MKSQPPPHATTKELVNNMRNRIDDILKSSGETSKVSGGCVDLKRRKDAEFWLNRPLVNKKQVLCWLLILHPCFSFEVTESRIIVKPDKQVTGIVRSEVAQSLPYTAPKPK